jgi:ABC-2 type transport system permease protein
MRWRRIRAVVRRDLTVALGSKAVVLPALLVPLVLLVLLPALTGLVPRFIDEATAGDVDALLALLSPEALAGLPDDPGLRTAVVIVTYLLSPLILMVPVMLAAVIAADGIAGEKERHTLEGLLLTPLTDRELATAKLLSALVPAVTLGIVGALMYATVANLAVGLQLGQLILPTVEFLVMALWVGPTFAAASLGAVLLVSVRVNSTQEAFQIGGVVVLPVVILLVSQATGALLLSTWLLAAAGAVALAIAIGLVRLATTSLARPTLGPKLG